MAATLDYKITRFGTPIGNNLLSFPLGGNVTVAAGAFAITDGTTGNIKDAAGSLVAADVVWGVIQERRPFLADPASSVAGTYLVPVECGSFYFQNGGTGGDALSQANVGATVYVTGEQSVGLTSSGGTRPTAGTLINVDTTQPGGYAVKIVNQGP